MDIMVFVTNFRIYVVCLTISLSIRICIFHILMMCSYMTVHGVCIHVRVRWRFVDYDHKLDTARYKKYLNREKHRHTHTKKRISNDACTLTNRSKNRNRVLFSLCSSSLEEQLIKCIF